MLIDIDVKIFFMVFDIVGFWVKCLLIKYMCFYLLWVKNDKGCFCVFVLN